MPSVAAGSLPLFRLGTAAQQEAAWGPVTGPALPQPQPPGAATRPVGQGLIRGWQQQGPDVSSTRPTTQSFLPLPSPPAWALPTRAALPGRTLGSTGHWVHRDPRQQEPQEQVDTCWWQVHSPPWRAWGRRRRHAACLAPCPRKPRSLQDEPLLTAKPQRRSPRPGFLSGRSGVGRPLDSATSLTAHTLSPPLPSPFLHLGPRTGPTHFILWSMSCQTNFLFIERPGDGQVSHGPRLHSCTWVCCPWSHPVLARLLGQSYKTPPKHQEGGRKPCLLILRVPAWERC